MQAPVQHRAGAREVTALHQRDDAVSSTILAARGCRRYVRLLVEHGSRCATQPAWSLPAKAVMARKIFGTTGPAGSFVRTTAFRSRQDALPALPDCGSRRRTAPCCTSAKGMLERERRVCANASACAQRIIRIAVAIGRQAPQQRGAVGDGVERRRPGGGGFYHRGVNCQRAGRITMFERAECLMPAG